MNIHCSARIKNDEERILLVRKLKNLGLEPRVHFQKVSFVFDGRLSGTVFSAFGVMDAAEMYGTEGVSYVKKKEKEEEWKAKLP